MRSTKVVLGLIMAGAVSMTYADVCKVVPGSVTCGKGTINNLSANGMVSVNGTTIDGPTIINGMLTADDANFRSLHINGSVSLIQCTVSTEADIKGTLNASSSKFESTLDIYSSSIRLINSKINNHLQVHHTDNQKQEIFLDNNSEVVGNIIFDDGNGKVYVSGGSSIGGKVIGGEVINK